MKVSKYSKYIILKLTFWWQFGSFGTWKIENWPFAPWPRPWAVADTQRWRCEVESWRPWGSSRGADGAPAEWWFGSAAPGWPTDARRRPSHAGAAAAPAGGWCRAGSGAHAACQARHCVGAMSSRSARPCRPQSAPTCAAGHRLKHTENIEISKNDQ